MKNLYIIGGGGHAKVVIDIVLSYPEYCIRGIFDDNKERWGHNIMGIPILPCFIRDGILKTKDSQDTFFVLGIGDILIRKKMLKWIESELVGVHWTDALVHRKSIRLSCNVIGVGTIVCAGSIIGVDAVVGNHCIVNTGSQIDHDCIIRDNVHISPASVLLGGVEIKDNTWVGSHSTVLPKVSVGECCVIGANTLIRKELSDYKKVVGNPAREINYL